MQNTLPRVVLIQSANRSQRDVIERGGKRLVYGFSSIEKARDFLHAREMTQNWEAAPLDAMNMKPWLDESLSQGATLLALDPPSDLAGELITIEIEKAIRAIQSQNVDGQVELTYSLAR